MNTTSGAADLLDLIEAYAEARHRQGHSSYNAQTAAALQAVKAALAAGQATAAQQGAAYAALPEPLSKRPSEANTLVWVADPISSTGVRGVFVDDITCLWWWGAGLIFQKEADAAALALRMRSAIASNGQASSQAGEYPALVCDYCGALTPDPWHSSGMLHGKMSKHIHSCDACAARVAQDAREPLTPERVKEIVQGAGYDQCGIPDTERAAFINGLRHGERDHGIRGDQHGTK